MFNNTPTHVSEINSTLKKFNKLSTRNLTQVLALGSALGLRDL